MRDYIFGKEIVRFTLEVYKEGEMVDPSAAFGPTHLPCCPETLRLFDEDDEFGDRFVEVVSGSVGRDSDSCVVIELKVLKPFWVISLEYFPSGGIDYEVHEGIFRDYWRGYFLKEAAAIFQERKNIFERQREQGIERANTDFDFFYATANTWWSGGRDFWEDDTELHFELGDPIEP